MGGSFYEFIPTGGSFPFIPTGGSFFRFYSHGRVIFSDLFPREGHIFPTGKTNGKDWDFSNIRAIIGFLSHK